MRISKIKISETITSSVGLKEINLTKKPLGALVALVGRNGAGKTRILKLVETFTNNLSPIDLASEYITHLPTTFNSIKPHISNIRSILDRINSHLTSKDDEMRLLSSLNDETKAASELFKQLGPAYIKVVDNDDLKNIKTNITNDLNFEQILENFHFNAVNKDLITFHRSSPEERKSILLNEFSILNSFNTIQYIQKLSRELVAEQFRQFLDHQDALDKVNDKVYEKEAYKLFNKFQNYVKQFLGKEFSYKPKFENDTLTSVLHFNSQPFDITLLSPGQKTLFAYAILFFLLEINSNTNIKESIVIIDEPEKHLHPESQIALIDALRKVVSEKGQLWIATHSINILSHLNYDEILMVKDDAIVPPSRTTPGHSYNDLMGLEDHIEELKSFITSISEWSYANFMMQCFKEPDVIFDNNKNDKQFELFREFIKDYETIDLLDFGAGKGRIGYTLSEDLETSKRINYHALEPNKANYELLSKVPKLIGIFSAIDEIADSVFDCILLCNVLHEINPHNWEEVFIGIKRLLKENGYLIIIEDKYLPKGETAHSYGYLILEKEQLSILANSGESIVELKLKDPNYRDRIIFCALPKNSINIDRKSVIKSISSLRDKSFINLKYIRNQKKDLNQGRIYANLTQLYINAHLALEDLNKKV